MVTCQQVRRLFKLVQTEKNFGIAALKAGMDEGTARKYRRLGKLPGELNTERAWRTREDPFDDVWPEIQFKLDSNPGDKLGDVLNLQTYLSKSEYLFAFASFSPRITALPTAVTD